MESANALVPLDGGRRIRIPAPRDVVAVYQDFRRPLLVVASPRASRVTFVDPRTRRVAWSLTGFGSPVRLEAVGGIRVYVVDEARNEIDVVDLDLRRIVRLHVRRQSRRQKHAHVFGRITRSQVKLADLAQTAGCHSDFFADLARGAYLSGFARIDSSSRQFEQRFSGGMTVLAHKPDPFVCIDRHQRGRAAMRDDIELHRIAVRQLHLIPPDPKHPSTVDFFRADELVCLSHEYGYPSANLRLPAACEACVCIVVPLSQLPVSNSTIAGVTSASECMR